MIVRKVLLITAVLLLASGGWVAVRGKLAQQHLTAARTELQFAKGALLDRRLKPAAAALNAAGRDTLRARRLTSDLVWRAAAALPYAGASLSAAADIAQAADEVARGALPPAFAAATVLDPKQLRGADGTINVALLRRAQPSLERAELAATVASDRLAHVPGRGLIPAVRTAATDLGSQTRLLSSTLVGIARGVRLAPALLGDDRSRNYFVLIQQTSESRGTGGLPGGFAILQAAKGHLKITAQGSNADLRSGPLPPPPGVPADYVRRYADNGAFNLWVNVNLSPDLPVVAKVIADRWRHQSGQQVDGVITVDSQALADILRGSPAIPVTKAKQLAPDDIVDYLAVGQYRDFATPKGFSGGVDRSQARKQLLVTIARAATDRLVGGGGSTMDLLRGLADAVSSGHLRMASDDPQLRPELKAAGIDGALPAGPAPLAYPVLFNSSGGKLDYFVDRSIRYEAGACSGRSRSSRVTLDLTNTAPVGLPGYLTNPGNQRGIANSRTDRLTVAIYGTRGARLTRSTLDGRSLDGAPGVGFLDGSVEAGLPVWTTLMDLPTGTRRRLVLELVEPTAKGAARVPEQPLARPLIRRVAVPNC